MTTPPVDCKREPRLYHPSRGARDEVSETLRRQGMPAVEQPIQVAATPAPNEVDGDVERGRNSPECASDSRSQWPRSTSDTVACETPAERATSTWRSLRRRRTARVTAPSRRLSTPRSVKPPPSAALISSIGSGGHVVTGPGRPNVRPWRAGSRAAERGGVSRGLVELQGLEPWTSCMPCRRSSS